MQIENPNNKSNISLANNEKKNKSKISTENERHRSNSSLLAKENNGDKEIKNDEKEKRKLKNSAVKKTLLILGDRPVLSKTHRFEENLNDANRSFENNKEHSNAFQSVQKHRLQNPKNIVICHLNLNSLRNKFEAVEELVQSKIDICLLSETKIDETFSNQKFMINGYKLFRRDRNYHGGVVLCYINENIPSKTVNVDGVVKIAISL